MLSDEGLAAALVKVHVLIIRGCRSIYAGEALELSAEINRMAVKGRGRAEMSGHKSLVEVNGAGTLVSLTSPLDVLNTLDSFFAMLKASGVVCGCGETQWGI